MMIDERSLDEAILEFKERAEYSRKMSELGLKNYIPISKEKEEKQIVEWLEELKDYRDKNKLVVRVNAENMDSIKDKINELSKYAESRYNKAIDDFVKALQKKIEKDLANPDLALECKKCGIWKNYDIKEIAEQLKTGGK